MTAITALFMEFELLTTLAATTNLITNPSFETNTTGWGKGGTNTIAQSTDQAKFGSNSMKCTFQNSFLLANYVITLTAAAHTLSAWIYVPSDYDGTGLRLNDANFVGATGQSGGEVDMTKTDQWQFVSRFVTVDSGDLAGSIQLADSTGPTAGKFVYLDAVQAEAKAAATPYFDGSLGTGYAWTGTAHASTSTRDAGDYPIWTDKAEDVLINKVINVSYGIRGLRPTDRLAKPGKMTLYLDNSSGNSESLEGLYSPGHANAKSGFVLGTNCRLVIWYNGTGYYKFFGKIGKIHPKEGTKGPRWVKLRIDDWLKDAQMHKVKLINAQENQRSDTFAATVIANLNEQPRATSYGTGQETFPFVGDDVTEGRTTAYTLLQRAIMSEFGYAMVIGDQTGGGTFLWQNRHARYKDRTLQATITGGDVAAIKAEYDPSLIFNIINTKINPRNVGTGPEILAELDSPIELVIGASETIKLNYRDPDSADVSMSGKDIQDPEGLNELDAASIADDFESGVAGWNAVDSTISQSTDEAKEGSNSLKIVCDTGGSKESGAQTDIFATVVQNDVLYLNAWVKTSDSPPADWGMYVVEYDASNVEQTEGLVEEIVSFPTSGFQRLRGTYTIQDSDTTQIRIQFKPSSVQTYAGEIFYVDEVHIIHDSNLNFEFSAGDQGGGDLNNELTFTGSDLGGSGAEFAVQNVGPEHGFITVLRARGIAIRVYNPVTLPIADSDSITSHGDRPIALNLPYITSRVKGEVFGKDVRGDYKDPVRWVKSFMFHANRNSTLLAAALSIEPGKRIKFTESVTAVDTEYFLNGVRLRIRNKSFIDCTWFVTLAKTQTFWEMETVGKSEMETATRLAP